MPFFRILRQLLQMRQFWASFFITLVIGSGILALLLWLEVAKTDIAIVFALIATFSASLSPLLNSRKPRACTDQNAR